MMLIINEKLFSESLSSLFSDWRHLISCDVVMITSWRHRRHRRHNATATLLPVRLFMKPLSTEQSQSRTRTAKLLSKQTYLKN